MLGSTKSNGKTIPGRAQAPDTTEPCIASEAFWDFPKGMVAPDTYLVLLWNGQRFPLLLDESHVVRNVVGDSLQQDFQSQCPIPRMPATPLKVFRRQGS